MTEETIFARIIRREIPADIVYQDDLVTAFQDIHPQAPVHVLIVTNRAIATTNDIQAEDEPALGGSLPWRRSLPKRWVLMKAATG